MRRKHRFNVEWLTLNRLVVAIVFLAVFAMATRYPADSDTWWHLQAGKTMLAQKTLLTTDLYSHTQAGSGWINHSWLAQIFWYGLLAVGGWPGLAIGLAAVVTLSFWLVWRHSEGNLYVRAFGVVLGAITSSLVWAARPQMISFLLAAAAAFLLNRFKRQGGRLLPWLPLLVLVWVNSHGGYAIAFILLACYMAGDAANALAPGMRNGAAGLSRAEWRHLFLTAALCLAVVAINPHTWRMWLYPFKTVGIGVLRDFIAEWQSPDFHRPIVQPFLLMLLLLLAAIARCGRKVDWTDLALVGAWVTLSLLAVRNVAIFAVVCTPVLTRYATLALEAHFGPLTMGRPRALPRPLASLNWALLGLLVVASGGRVAGVVSPAAIAAAEAERFPVEAVTFVQQAAPDGPLFNSYNIGGYLIYHLWPDYPVFVDGRTDLYDDSFLRMYLKTANALPGWQATLNRYRIQLIIIERDTPLALALQHDAGWQQLFAGERAAVFQKIAAAAPQ
ncbi:MAG: hypothetical protein ACE5G8_06820 [Anaerolineae bacterium]